MESPGESFPGWGGMSKFLTSEDSPQSPAVEKTLLSPPPPPPPPASKVSKILNPMDFMDIQIYVGSELHLRAAISTEKKQKEKRKKKIKDSTKEISLLAKITATQAAYTECVAS